jgi:hypothetical protein
MRDVLREPPFYLKPPIPAQEAVSSSAQDVVSVSKPDGPSDTAYLMTHHEGQSRIRYFGKGEGFLVTVIDPSSGAPKR